ncbi:hypothetical protein pipiens_005098 [Culex pipiens pipiens]|uniref:CCHC-type domain-containing protein n=1 Tax=Culex pipiens pipiens TaxID=38569 RepID=A0ABD1CBI3_CULPP
MTNARVFLEMGSTEQAEALVLKHHLKHALQADSQDYAIPLYMADGSVEVKVYDLPPYLPNGTIAKHLSAFGEVLSIKDDVWQKFFPGVPNGTRTVRMKLKKSIPSYVNMEDECAYVKYRNQIATCRYCGRNLHIGSKCSDVKKALSGNSANGLTLAQIVGGMNPIVPNDEDKTPAKETFPPAPAKPIIVPAQPATPAAPVKPIAPPVFPSDPMDIISPPGPWTRSQSALLNDISDDDNLPALDGSRSATEVESPEQSDVDTDFGKGGP